MAITSTVQLHSQVDRMQYGITRGAGIGLGTAAVVSIFGPDIKTVSSVAHEAGAVIRTTSPSMTWSAKFTGDKALLGLALGSSIFAGVVAANAIPGNKDSRYHNGVIAAAATGALAGAAFGMHQIHGVVGAIAGAVGGAVASGVLSSMALPFMINA